MSCEKCGKPTEDNKVLCAECERKNEEKAPHGSALDNRARHNELPDNGPSDDQRTKRPPASPDCSIIADIVGTALGIAGLVCAVISARVAIGSIAVGLILMLASVGMSVASFILGKKGIVSFRSAVPGDRSIVSLVLGISSCTLTFLSFVYDIIAFFNVIIACIVSAIFS